MRELQMGLEKAKLEPMSGSSAAAYNERHFGRYAPLVTMFRLIPQTAQQAAGFRSFLVLLYLRCRYHAGNRLPRLRLRGKAPTLRLNLRLGLSKVRVHLRPNAGDVRAVCDVLLGGEYDLPEFNPQNIRTILDVGAHIGMSALRFRWRFPGARLVCVEADPANFSLLERNVSGAHLINAAAWSRPGVLSLHISEETIDSSVVPSVPNETSPVVNVEAQTLDDMLNEAAVSRVDLLKMDIEGAEAELLTKGGAWLGNTRILVVELHPGKTGYGIEQLRRDMQRHGFVVTRELPHPVCTNLRLLED